MHTAHARRKKFVAQSGPYIRKFVCHNRHADSGAADQNPALHLAASNRTGNLFSKSG